MGERVGSVRWAVKGCWRRESVVEQTEDRVQAQGLGRMGSTKGSRELRVKEKVAC